MSRTTLLDRRVLAAAACCILSASAQIPAPAVPVAPTCGALTATSVTLSWSPVPGASLYDLEVAAASPPGSVTGTPIPFASVTSNTANAEIAELAPATRYTFMVRAHATAAGPTQMIDGWSNFSDTTMCKTAGSVRTTGARVPTELRRTSPLHETEVAIAWSMPSTDEYRTSCAVTAHRRTAGKDEAPLVWNHLNLGTTEHRLTGLVPDSTYDVRILCGGRSSDALPVRTANPATTWLEVFRVAENFKTWPDFLANHNSGTLEGDVAFLTGSGRSSNHSKFFDFFESPRVRYCVEMAKVNLTNIPRTPSGPPEIPTNYAFAEYLSCDPFFGAYYANYSCLCDNLIDRKIARQTANQTAKYCPESGGPGGRGGHGGNRSMGDPCDCDPGSVAASLKHLGFMPVSLPFDPFDPPQPGIPPDPFGGWFSHPGDAKCPDNGSPVGTNGCTWRRDPRATMVYGQDLLETGWKFGVSVNQPTPPQPVPKAVMLNNAEAMRKAFNKISTRCCGC